jgi:hypothetical protein
MIYAKISLYQNIYKASNAPFTSPDNVNNRVKSSIISMHVDSLVIFSRNLDLKLVTLVKIGEIYIGKKRISVKYPTYTHILANTHNRVKKFIVATDSLVNFLRNLHLATLIKTGGKYIGKNESLSSLLHIRIFWQTHTTESKFP